jgi:hypothetical protein
VYVVVFVVGDSSLPFDAAIDSHYSTTLLGRRRRMVEESLLATCMKQGLFDMQRIHHVRRMKAIHRVIPAPLCITMLQETNYD